MATVPLHERLADALRERIASGVLKLGDPLPSEAELCAEFGVSRGPVRQALAGLRAEGAIGGGRGKPPVVRAQPTGQPFESLMSFSAWARSLGRVPGQRTLEIALRPARARVAEALGLEPGQPVVELLRLRLLDGQPALLERTSFVEPVGRLLFDFDCDSGSIFEHLRGQGVDLGVARHEIDAVAADETDARLLEVEAGTPLLRERRRTTDAWGSPVEWSDDRYRSDLVTFTIENAEAHTRPAIGRDPRRTA